MDTSVKSHQTSLLIKLVALKKGLFAVILIAISLLSAFSWRHFDLVTAWSENYVVTAEYGFVRWLLTAIVHSSVPTLQWIARISGIYGVLLGITSIGLWQRRAWADLLFAVLVGMLIPLEVLELLHHATLVKAIIFAINVLIFAFVVRHWLERHQENESSEPA